MSSNLIKEFFISILRGRKMDMRRHQRCFYNIRIQDIFSLSILTSGILFFEGEGGMVPADLETGW